MAGGLAPASFLFAAGVAGLFNTDSDSLLLAATILVPALLGGLVFKVAWQRPNISYIASY